MFCEKEKTLQQLLKIRLLVGNVSNTLKNWVATYNNNNNNNNNFMK